eukprot:1158801-Pelagomonas_calceolata.AAC.14
MPWRLNGPMTQEQPTAMPSVHSSSSMCSLCPCAPYAHALAHVSPMPMRASIKIWMNSVGLRFQDNSNLSAHANPSSCPFVCMIAYFRLWGSATSRTRRICSDDTSETRMSSMHEGMGMQESA